MSSRASKNTIAAKSQGKSATEFASKPVLKQETKQDGPRLQIDSEVARCIRQHARSHMKTEVCGVLIGETLKGIVEVQASIEAINATQAGTHVTFTQDAWEAIYKVKDERYPDERIVGWYHSHPGFGVFLSEHDTFIHRNFFSSADQVAWVYDPHTDEEGCFGWIDGDIHRVPAFSIVDNSGDGIERTPKGSDSFDIDGDEELPAMLKADKASPSPAWLRWTVTTLSYVCALAVGFLVAYLLFPRFVAVPVDPMTGEPIFQTSHPVPANPGSSTPDPMSPGSPTPGSSSPSPGAGDLPDSGKSPSSAKPATPSAQSKAKPGDKK